VGENEFWNGQPRPTFEVGENGILNGKSHVRLARNRMYTLNCPHVWCWFCPDVLASAIDVAFKLDIAPAIINSSTKSSRIGWSFKF
jgi:hypothetical protein